VANKPSRPPFPKAGTPTSPDEVVIGRVAGCFGVRGELKIEPLVDLPERYANRQPLTAIFSDGRRGELTPIGARSHKSHILVRFEGVNNANEGELLRGVLLVVPRSELGELPEDTYYVNDLVGLMVVTTSGEEIGPILQVLESPANDVYVTARGMVPAVKQFVREVNLTQGRVLVEPIDGMFEPACGEEA